jgi:hypothetical protein
MFKQSAISSNKSIINSQNMKFIVQITLISITHRLAHLESLLHFAQVTPYSSNLVHTA